MSPSFVPSRMAGVIGLAALLCCASARADEVTDINKLVRAGQLPAAMAKIDVALAQHPKDAQLRFIKGMIFSEQGRTNDAIAIFQKLTEDYPELPEPYNNLAVLYAGSGQYDKARVALERAIRTNPTYATAHENLGDVYAKLASQSYDKAMQILDTPAQTPPPKSKLAMVRTLKAPGGAAHATAPASGTVAASTAAAASAPAMAPAPTLVSPQSSASAQSPATIAARTPATAPAQKIAAAAPAATVPAAPVATAPAARPVSPAPATPPATAAAMPTARPGATVSATLPTTTASTSFARPGAQASAALPASTAAAPALASAAKPGATTPGAGKPGNANSAAAPAMNVAANGPANRPATPVSSAVSAPPAPELVHVKPGMPLAAAGGAASVPAKQPAAPAAPTASAVQLAKAEPTKTDATDKADSSKADINKAVEQWAKAWSAQDMKGYLNAYGSSFQPPRGQSRQAWAAERSARIEGKEHIKVSVEAPQIAVNGNTATVKFRQIYVSDRLKANSRKTLVMEKQGNKWVIKQEQSGG